jgi:teichoic acid transport system ATP-binding protein
MEDRIIVANLAKTFKKTPPRGRTALARVLSLIYREKKDFQVLRDISFSVKPGENLGIIGRNGSGKTTLMRMIAGIYTPDSGKVETRGNLVFLSGLANGLKPRLSVRDNIHLVGSILGLSQRDIRAKFREIVEFAGLGEFVDTEVNKLSDGMKSKLAFSITIHCLHHQKPEILLLDEVFAGGGDEEFKEKSIKKMEDLIKGGASVIFISHSLDLIKKYCDKVIWVEKGEIVANGKPEEIIESYLEFVKNLRRENKKNAKIFA